MVDDGEVRAKDPKYVFCLADHRKQLFHIFAKHFANIPFSRNDLPTIHRIQKNISGGRVWDVYILLSKWPSGSSGLYMGKLVLTEDVVTLGPVHIGVPIMSADSHGCRKFLETTEA